MSTLFINPNSLYNHSDGNFILPKDAMYSFNRSISVVNSAVFGFQPTRSQLLSGFELSDCKDNSLCVKVDYLMNNVDSISSVISDINYISDEIDRLCAEISTDVETSANALCAALKSEIDDRISGDEQLSYDLYSKLSINLLTTDGGEYYSSTYTITQGSKEIGKINIPKDKVVNDAYILGSVLHIKFENVEDELTVDFSSFIDTYTGDNGDETRISVSVEDHKISAKLLDKYYPLSDGEKLSNSLSDYVKRSDIVKAIEKNLSGYHQYLSTAPQNISSMIYWMRGLHRCLVDLPINYDLEEAKYTIFTYDNGDIRKIILDPADKTLNASDISADVVEVKVGSTIAIIGDECFANSIVSSVHFPDSIESINDYAFDGCENLKEIRIPNNPSLSIISEGVFANTALTSFEIPDNIVKISNSAFYNCQNLSTLAIPDSITDIGENAFGECPNLSVFLDKTKSNIDSSSLSNYSLWGVEESRLIFKPEETPPDPGPGPNPDPPTPIVHDPLLTYALYNDGTIREFDIEGQLNGIDNLDNLVDLSIGNKVTKIPETFFNSKGISAIHISESVEDIDSSAFIYCSSLSTFDIAESNQYYKVVNNLILSKDGKQVVAGNNDGKVIIPNTVSSINDYAFTGHNGLLSLSIDSNSLSIGRMTFGECSNLKTILISENVETLHIGQEAFLHCASLRKSTIPSTLTNLSATGWQPFYRSDSASFLFEDRTATEIRSMSGYPWTLDERQIIAGKSEVDPDPTPGEDTISVNFYNANAFDASGAIPENLVSAIVKEKPVSISLEQMQILSAGLPEIMGFYKFTGWIDVNTNPNTEYFVNNPSSFTFNSNAKMIPSYN